MNTKNVDKIIPAPAIVAMPTAMVAGVVFKKEINPSVVIWKEGGNSNVCISVGPSRLPLRPLFSFCRYCPRVHAGSRHYHPYMTVTEKATLSP